MSGSKSMSMSVQDRAGGSAGQEAGDGFGAGSDVEFFVDVSEVGVDGLDADRQFVGDFFGAITAGEESEDLALALSQICLALGRWRVGLEGLHEHSGNLAGHRRAAAMDFFDGRKDS